MRFSVRHDLGCGTCSLAVMQSEAFQAMVQYCQVSPLHPSSGPLLANLKARWAGPTVDLEVSLFLSRCDLSKSQIYNDCCSAATAATLLIRCQRLLRGRELLPANYREVYLLSGPSLYAHVSVHLSLDLTRQVVTWAKPKENGDKRKKKTKQGWLSSLSWDANLSHGHPSLEGASSKRSR